MKLNLMTAKWIGLRAAKIGTAAKTLKRAGFWRSNHACVNNRVACDFIKPCGSKGIEDFKSLFEKIEAAGFEGIALEWRDIQWKHNAGITDAQWQARIQIG